jgi:methionine-S-sulfoxide reductase
VRTRRVAGLSGEETFDIVGVTALDDGPIPATVRVTARGAGGSETTFDARVRIDTPGEATYYRHGGILQYVLRHHVHGRPITPPWPEGHELLVVGMGCFWGAERLFWSLDGVWTTFVGYAGGGTPNPTYREVCTGLTGHAEIAGVVYDPEVVDLETLFAAFWENHDPTQGDRQGNDIGPQYRSIVLTTTERQLEVATASLRRYQEKLGEVRIQAPITTTIAPLGELYWAEAEHQQYLSKLIPRELRLPPEHLFPPTSGASSNGASRAAGWATRRRSSRSANGFLGMRGTLEEGRPAIEPGTFVNGFHETWPIVHAEEAYGFARTGPDHRQRPDATLLKLYVDDEPLFLPTARVTEYERSLDFREGVLRRDADLVDPQRQAGAGQDARLVSFEHRHLGAISYEVTVDSDAPVVVSSQLLNRQDARAEDEPRNGNGADPRRARGFGHRVLNAKNTARRTTGCSSATGPPTRG